MKKPAVATTRKKSTKPVKDLAPKKSNKVSGGRTEARLNAGGPNPLVIARDRSGVS